MNSSATNLEGTFAGALLVVDRWKSKFSIPVLMVGAGLIGWLWINE